MTSLPTDTTDNVSTLPLIRELAQTMHDEGIEYCHWKGTYALESVARGEKDLDLLVNRRDYGRFLAILSRLGFKEAYAGGGNLPGVHHYYGYDDERGRLVHVHSQNELVMGSVASGTYRLPVEGPYLASAIAGDPFKIPQPEFELVLFVARMALWRSPTSVLHPFKRTARIPARRRNELAYLRERADSEVVLNILREHIPQLDERLFRTCLDSLEHESRTRDRARSWWRLQAVANPWPHRSRPGQLGLVLWRRTVRTMGRWIGRRSPKRRLATGGAIIAFVGGDGAGKSTAIDSLSSWLSGELATKRVHLGKPRWSWTTWVVRGSLKGFRLVKKVIGRRVWNEAEWRATSTSYSALAWHVVRARDRYRLLLSARRAAIRGDIVLCDRFPQTGPVQTDGPRLDRLLSSDTARSRLGRWIRTYLTKLERRYYALISQPDLLIVLKLHPDIAAVRKPEEGVEWVRRRSREIWEADWSQVRAEVVDASRPVDELHATLRALTWPRL